MPSPSLGAYSYYQDNEKTRLECFNCNDLRLIGENRNIKSINIAAVVKCRLPEEVFWQKDLKELFLNVEKLYLPKNVNITTLEALSIGEQPMKEVPNFIWNNKNLEALSIGLDNFKQIEGKIGSLNKLTYLSVYINKLTSLPTDIFKLSNLEYLSIHLASKKKQMKSFPSDLKQLPKLKALCLPISFELLEEHLDKLHLTEFHVKTANSVESVIEVLKKYPNIKKINIDSWKQEDLLKVRKVLPYIEFGYL
jgi:Leucine-rich repeat (LRR) protein